MAEGSSIADEPGDAELLCARFKYANREVSEEKVDHNVFSSYGS